MLANSCTKFSSTPIACTNASFVSVLVSLSSSVFESSTTSSTTSSSGIPIRAIIPSSSTTSKVPSAKTYSPTGILSRSSSTTINTSLPISNESALIIVPSSRVASSNFKCSFASDNSAGVGSFSLTTSTIPKISLILSNASIF